MNELRAPTFRQAALFAILMDGILLVLGWLLIGPPQTMQHLASFKVTAVIGLPTITQLLEPRHQFSVIGFHEFGVLKMIIACLMYVLFLLVSAYYIGLLARSKRAAGLRPATDAIGDGDHPAQSGSGAEQSWQTLATQDAKSGWQTSATQDATRGWQTSATQDAARAWPTLFGWMIVQMAVQAVLAYGIAVLGGRLGQVVIGAVVILAMLAFRFVFLYVEYAAVVLRLRLLPAMKKALALLGASLAESFLRFFTLCIVSFVLGYAVNALFNVPVLMGTLLVNALVQTWLQLGLMESFFRAQQRLHG